MTTNSEAIALRANLPGGLFSWIGGHGTEP